MWAGDCIFIIKTQYNLFYKIKYIQHTALKIISYLHHQTARTTHPPYLSYSNHTVQRHAHLQTNTSTSIYSLFSSPKIIQYCGESGPTFDFCGNDHSHLLQLYTSALTRQIQLFSGFGSSKSTSSASKSSRTTNCSPESAPSDPFLRYLRLLSSSSSSSKSSQINSTKCITFSHNFIESPST